MLGWTHPHVNWIFRIQLWCNMNSISTTFSFYACVSGPTIDKGTLCTRRTVVAWVSVWRGAWEMIDWISSVLIFRRIWLNVYACVSSFMIARFVYTFTSVRFFFWLGVPISHGCSYLFGNAVLLQGCFKYLFSCKFLLHKHKLYGNLSQLCY